MSEKEDEVKLFETKNRNNKTEYYFKGYKIDKSKYWILRLKIHIKNRKDIYFHHRVSPDQQAKMLILMDIWNVHTPSALISKLIDEYYALIRLKQVRKILSKKDKKKE